MDVAKAVMVTAELDFGPKVPSIAEALNQIERRYKPDDGQGRTAAWTSDIGPHWLPQAFAQWQGYPRLWRQALAWLTRQA